MKLTLLLAAFALSACTNPMLSANMAFGTETVSVTPVLSGTIGGTTVSIQPD